MNKAANFLEEVRLAKKHHHRIVLTAFDEDIAREIVASKPPGIYTLPQLYGDAWDINGRERWFGRQFSDAVEAKKLGRIRRAGTASNNHALYEVY